MPAIQLQGWGDHVVVVPDGSRAWTCGDGGEIGGYLLTDLLQADRRPADDLRLLGELIAGQQILQGDITGLTSAEWLARWRQWRAKYPNNGRPE